MSSFGGGGKSLGNTRVGSQKFGTNTIPWSRIEDILGQVRSWPGINVDQVNMAYRRALDDGTIDFYKNEAGSNPQYGLVLTPNLDDLASTFQYAVERLKEVFGPCFTQWPKAYHQPMTTDRIRSVQGSPLFVPGRIKFEIVDFGAYWNAEQAFYPDALMHEKPRDLAGVQVLFAASQHPNWIRRMDGSTNPFTLAPALLLNTDNQHPWSTTPRIWKDGEKIDLDASHIQAQCRLSSAPRVKIFLR